VIAQTVLKILEELLSSSVRELAKRMCIQPTTVYRRLANFMRFVVKHLHWFLHKINEANWVPRCKYQMNCWELYPRPNIKGGNSC
jgi:hypothetical protein